MSQRYVLLGIARARTPWFSEVARWCTSGALPAQFLKCVSVEEVRARLGSGRPFSALLVDGQMGTLDRDLVDVARAHGCAVIAITDADSTANLSEIGFTGRLLPDFVRSDLLEVLASQALLVTDTTTLPTDPVPDVQPPPWTGRMVTVCGSGGTGSSTMATAIAQGLGADPRHGGLVVLADLALHADQAVLHGTNDIMPGLPELVEACRRGRPSTEELQRLTFDVPRRSYRLLLGLRRHRDWSGLRRSSVDAALLGLRQAFQIVVTDSDADVEGDRQCGVVEIEDRNLLARRATAQSDVIVAVGLPGLHGTHALARTIADLVESGIDPGLLVPVVNRAPKRPAARAELTRVINALSPQLTHPPIFVPERSGVDDLHRDGTVLPKAMVGSLSRAVHHMLETAPPRETVSAEPERVVPGSLGSWSDPDRAAQ